MPAEKPPTVIPKAFTLPTTGDFASVTSLANWVRINIEFFTPQQRDKVKDFYVTHLSSNIKTISQEATAIILNIFNEAETKKDVSSEAAVGSLPPIAPIVPEKRPTGRSRVIQGGQATRVTVDVTVTHGEQPIDASVTIPGQDEKSPTGIESAVSVSEVKKPESQETRELKDEMQWMIDSTRRSYQSRGISAQEERKSNTKFRTLRTNITNIKRRLKTLENLTSNDTKKQQAEAEIPPLKKELDTYIAEYVALLAEDKKVTENNPFVEPNQGYLNATQDGRKVPTGEGLPFTDDSIPLTTLETTAALEVPSTEASKTHEQLAFIAAKDAFTSAKYTELRKQIDTFSFKGMSASVRREMEARLEGLKEDAARIEDRYYATKGKLSPLELAEAEGVKKSEVTKPHTTEALLEKTTKQTEIDTAFSGLISVAVLKQELKKIHEKENKKIPLSSVEKETKVRLEKLITEAENIYFAVRQTDAAYARILEEALKKMKFGGPATNILSGWMLANVLKKTEGIKTPEAIPEKKKRLIAGIFNVLRSKKTVGLGAMAMTAWFASAEPLNEAEAFFGGNAFNPTITSTETGSAAPDAGVGIVPSPDTKVSPPSPEKLGVAPAPDVLSNLNSSRPLQGIYTVQEGDNQWDISEGQTSAMLPRIFSEVPQRNLQALVDRTRDYLNAHPEVARSIGFTVDGNVGKIYQGDTLNLDIWDSVARVIAAQNGYIGDSTQAPKTSLRPQGRPNETPNTAPQRGVISDTIRTA